MRVGALYDGGGCVFRVFAPFARDVRLLLEGDSGVADGLPVDVPLRKREDGYWDVRIAGIPPGVRYRYRLDGGEVRPDPASFYQPQGVHGPSQVWDHASFRWTDEAWPGIPLHDYILYEIHPGTFTSQGTLEAVTSRLPHLRGLGVNALEIMPVAQFPGDRNWGYDGAYPFAVHNSYGGPDGFKRLVDRCHAHGFAVVLDVVYNHLGPEGSYLSEFGPYFSDRYKTPWGSAVNLDGPWSDQVRDYFIGNALYWFREFHVDTLRLDAIHQIYDLSATHFLAELKDKVAEFSSRRGRLRHLIAESDLNDPKVLVSRDGGGYGLQAQWLDDFQHCVDALIRGGESAYHRDYGAPEQFAQAIREGFVYAGEYCPSRLRRFGASSALRSPGQFIAFIQNHDQVGNRPHGERFSVLADFESCKLAAGALFVSPYIPLLFMGEEYGETRPFLFFADYSDPALIDAVRRGRKEEFAFLHSGRDVPDPVDPETFLRSRLDWSRLDSGRHATALAFHRELIALRKSLAALNRPDRTGMEVSRRGLVFYLSRRGPGNGVGDGERDGYGQGEAGDVFCILNFSPGTERMQVQARDGTWVLAMDSSDARWEGPGSHAPARVAAGAALELPGRSFLIYRRVDPD